MKHPFGGILDKFDSDDINHDTAEGQSRREALQTVIQVGVGAVAAGVVGTASAQDVTTLRVGEEGGARPPAVTRAGPGHPEHGGKRPGRPMTKAGGAHPEHAGKKVRSAMADLAKAQSSLKKGDWSTAAAKLTQVRKLAKPKDDKYGHYARLQKQREAMEKQLNKTITKALDKADKQAKADELVPALRTYRKAKGLDEHYGFAKRVDKALAEIAKHKDYQVALKKVEALEAKEKPKATTLALGEEGGATTKAKGEEGGGKITTFAVGEEGSGKIRRLPLEEVTSLAKGEEG